MSLAVLLDFTCLVAFVYFVYFYEQINDDDEYSYKNVVFFWILTPSVSISTADLRYIHLLIYCFCGLSVLA